MNTKKRNNQDNNMYNKYLENRVTTVPWIPELPVHIVYDFGIRDSISIILFQIVEQLVHIIDYSDQEGAGFSQCIKYMATLPYAYGEHIAPSYMESDPLKKFANDNGISFLFSKKPSNVDSLKIVIDTLPRIYIDSSKCEWLIKPLSHSLDKYETEGELHSVWRDYCWATQATDAMECLCNSLELLSKGLQMKTEKRIEYGLKQLNIEIPEEFLEEIKKQADERNIPMRTWLLRVIARGLRDEFKL